MSAYGRCHGCGSYGRWGHECICNTPSLRAAIPAPATVLGLIADRFPELEIKMSEVREGAPLVLSIDLPKYPVYGWHMGTPAFAVLHQISMLVGGLQGVRVDWAGSGWEGKEISITVQRRRQEQAEEKR